LQGGLRSNFYIVGAGGCSHLPIAEKIDMHAPARHKLRFRIAAPAARVDVASRIAVLDSSWLLAVVVALCAALIAILAALLWPPATITALMREHGPIENASVVWYGAALLAVWGARHPAFGKASQAAASILLVACVAKEISLRRQLLTAAGYEPCCARLTAWPNLIAGALLLALLLAAAWLIWRHSRRVLEALRRRQPFAVTLLVAFLCLAAAQVGERIQKTDSGQPGLAMSSTARAAALSFEEVLEMMFPVLIVLAALQVGVRVPGARPAHEKRSDST
jgi:hypothetical protein